MRSTSHRLPVGSDHHTASTAAQQSKKGTPNPSTVTHPTSIFRPAVGSFAHCRPPKTLRNTPNVPHDMLSTTTIEVLYIEYGLARIPVSGVIEREGLYCHKNATSRITSSPPIRTPRRCVVGECWGVYCCTCKERAVPRTQQNGRAECAEKDRWFTEIQHAIRLPRLACRVPRR